jgi:isoquinoline 1-oxidoreductase beta subunit
MSDSNAGRRHFLIGTAVVGTGLVIGLNLANRRDKPASGSAGGKSLSPNAWMRIAPDGTVTLALGKAEMGQGIMTGAAIALAEDLDVDPANIKVEFAGVNKIYNHPFLLAQFTGGSNSTQTIHDLLRSSGATARAMLLAAAAKRWQTTPAELRTDNGVVYFGSRKLSYGELADAAASETAPEKPALKAAADFKYIGRTQRRHDSFDKITGRAKFGLDVDVPDMLTAMVARAPVFGAQVKSFDGSEARKIAGVVEVKQIPTGIAVLASNTWAAQRGRDLVKIDWDLGAMAGFSLDQLRADYRAQVRKPGPAARNEGDVQIALGKPGARVIDVEFELPFLAHAPMEPLNCVVHARADGADVWTGTQNHSQDMENVATILGLKPEQVTLHEQYLGGGFGRRASTTSDFTNEAVHVARGAGRPVKTVWTREDDIRGGYYRPYSISRVRAAVDADGKPTAWYFSNVSQPVLLTSVFAAMAVQKDGRDPSSSEGAADIPYEIPNIRVDSINGINGVPILWWRSVANSFNAFAVNCAVDELAALAAKDPLEFRRGMLTNKPRHLAILERAAAMAGWGKPLAEGRFQGIALHESFGTIVGQVAEVSVSGADVRVHKVYCAADCGLAINPGQVEAQMQSGIVYGLSAALWGEITFENARVQQSNFDDYRVLRISETPAIEVSIIDSGAPLGGVGEPGTPPIAPAVAGAIFAATGKRIRTLPFARALA